MASGPLLSPEEFTIRMPLFRVGALVFFLGNLGGLFLDLEGGQTAAAILDGTTLVLLVGVSAAVWYWRLSPSVAVAILIYLGALNFLFSIVSNLFARSPDLDTAIYNNLFILALFLGVSTFLVGKTSSLVLGGMILTVLLSVSTIWNHAEVSGNLWFEIPVVAGASLLLYQYRGALDRLLADLKQAIEENRTLRDRERLAALGELTAGIAHEIKNPLNLVINFAESSQELLSDLQSNLERSPVTAEDLEERQYLLRELRQNLEDIRTQGQRGASTVQGMLLQTRKGNGEFQEIDLNKLAADCLHLSSLGHQGGKTVSGFHGSLQPVLVRGSLGDLSRALLNLCNNAFWSVAERARREGAGYRPTVWVTVEAGVQEARIVVTDNGVGLTNSVKAQLFVPFFTTKPAGEGTGLGLSLSHEVVVDQHGGRLEVSGSPESGAIFTVILPLGDGPL